MHIGDKGIQVITFYEGLYLTAYWDDYGKIWTIGYGHTSGVYGGMTITKEQAIEFLRQDCVEAENGVNAYITATLTQDEFDALVSFTFNVGSGTLRDSQIPRYINTGYKNSAGDEILKFTYAGGVQLDGLVKRRATERALFLNGDLSSIGGSTGGGTGTDTGDYILLNKYIYGHTDKLLGRKFSTTSTKFKLIKRIGDIAIIDDKGKKIRVPYKNLKKV